MARSRVEWLHLEHGQAWRRCGKGVGIGRRLDNAYLHDEPDSGWNLDRELTQHRSSLMRCQFQQADPLSPTAASEDAPTSHTGIPDPLGLTEGNYVAAAFYSEGGDGCRSHLAGLPTWDRKQVEAEKGDTEALQEDDQAVRGLQPTR